MAVKHALCIGVGKVDENHYLKAKPCATAKRSAKALDNLLTEEGYSSLFLDEKTATTHILQIEMERLSKQLKPGELLIISFTGHGERVDPIRDCNIDPEGKKDAGWCFPDRVFFFFELWELLLRFRKGVNVIIISDACFSGIGAMRSLVKKTTNSNTEISFFNNNKEEYDNLISNALRPLNYRIASSILFLSASSRYGGAYEIHGGEYTVFMNAFLKSWEIIKNLIGKSDNTATKGDYHLFFEGILLKILESNNLRNNKEQHALWHFYEGHERTELNEGLVSQFF